MQVMAIIQISLKDIPQSEIRKIHDTLVSSGKTNFEMLGNFSHHQYLDPNDPRGALSIDLWNVANLDQVKMFYHSPEFQAAMAPLTDGPAKFTFVVDSGWMSY